MEQLSEDLASPLEEVRYASLRAAQGDPSVPIGLYLRALGDESWRVRKEAMHALCTNPQAELTMAALGEALSIAASERLRAAAAETLLLFGGAALPTLLRVLQGGTNDGRRRSAAILGDLGLAAATAPLRAALCDPDRHVRLAAAEALTGLGTEAAVAALVAEAEHSADFATRLACLDALVTLRETPPLRILTVCVRNPATRRVALRLLGHCTEPEATGPCVQALSDRSRANREAALCAVNTLRCLGLSAGEFERAREAMAGNDFRLLREALASGDRDAATSAMALAGWLGAAEIAIDVARAPTSETERRTALAALSAMGEAGAQVLLAAAAEAPSAERAAALDTLGSLPLGELASMRARTLARSALEDPHALVATAAARALGALGSLDDVPALLHLMERGNRPLLVAAAEALRLLSAAGIEPLLSAAVLRPLGQRDEVDAFVCELCAQLAGQAALPLSLATLRSGGPRGRLAALATLGRIAPAVVAGELVPVLLREESTGARLGVLEALSAIAARHPSAEDATDALAVCIEGALDSSDIAMRARATTALCGLGAERAMSQLLALVEDDTPEVAVAAVTAARALGDAAQLADRLTLYELAVEHNEPVVVRAGAAALAGIHSEAAVKALCTALGHPRFEVRIAAVRALAAQGAAGQPPLRAQLAVEEDPLVRDAVHSML